MNHAAGNFSNVEPFQVLPLILDPDLKSDNATKKSIIPQVAFLAFLIEKAWALITHSNYDFFFW